jgi:hypothetical protein
MELKAEKAMVTCCFERVPNDERQSDDRENLGDFHRKLRAHPGFFSVVIFAYTVIKATHLHTQSSYCCRSI